MVKNWSSIALFPGPGPISPGPADSDFMAVFAEVGFKR